MTTFSRLTITFNLKVNKSLVLDEINPQVLKEQVDEFARSLSIIFERPGSLLKFPLTGKVKHNPHVQEGEKREYRPVILTSVARPWSRSSQRPYTTT